MQIKLLDKKCMPYRANANDAGIDLRTRESITLRPGEWGRINTGIKIKIPNGNFGLVVPRSGLGSQGLNLRNTAGIIDSDYVGEVFINVVSKGVDYIILEKYQRVFQLIIIPYTYIELEEVDELKNTERGENGFGSSGTH